ncbi:hypothetical protein [Streptomyces sp. NBC_01304]|uniref:hypothetical protein n=1 Tax=Streptomyces sp. NBC_01304 TaxID=2903818 RepID=UPI002E10998B
MTSVNYFFRHPMALKVREEGREEGRAQARAEMILEILDWRDIPVPPSVRDRVLACTDLDQLHAWAKRAVQVDNAEDLFVPGAA